MGKNGISKKRLNKHDKKIFVEDELKRITEKIVFLEGIKQVNIKGYQLFIGEIDFDVEIKENYNIYHEDNKKFVKLAIFPYGIFYEEMYILENKENDVKFDVFFRIELEGILFQKNHLVSLYKQKNLQIAVNEFFTYNEHNIDTQIIFAIFTPKLYFINKNTTNLCIKNAYQYILNEYFKNKIRVKEYCEDNVYVKESLSRQNISSLEEYFNIVLLREAYNEIKNNHKISYNKSVVIEGAKISIKANEEEGKRDCKIYLILNNNEYFFAYGSIDSKVINITLEITAFSYQKVKSYTLYDDNTYNSTLKEFFEKLSIEDLS